MIDGCLVYLRDDGMFQNAVDRPETFPEVNLLADAGLHHLHLRRPRGLAGPRLPLRRADWMRVAAHDQVDAYGFVRNVCGAPMFDRPGVAPSGRPCSC
ncbi:MAG: hypothetical protein IPK19_23165 [Chloroflexi bacterium]|nr:hypothetical protein [Chloroflexota bacterium]